MKCFIVISLLVTFQLVASKHAEKPGNKKASSAKPTKTPKSVLEHFTELPADDLEFLKQLDKQFKLHGEKVKIKVERVNKTSTDGKNSKRTIDGELGYGYYGNQNNNGFYFTKPKIVYYRYSQPGQDIPPAPAHSKQHSYGQDNVHETVTDIQIQPSQSFELKDANGYQGYQNSQEQQYYHQQQHQQQHSNEPVIVLRIPGPQKYAAHLQALLQQYLELRAAQLFKEFEEQEQGRQHQPQAQALVQPAQHYGAPPATPYYAPVAQPSYPHDLAPVYPQAMYHTAVSHVQQQYVYSQGGKSQESDQHQQQEADYQYEQPQYQTQQQHYSADQQYEQHPQAEQQYQHQEDGAQQQYEQQYYSQQDYSAEQPQTQVITKYVYEKPVSEPTHTQQAAHGDDEDLQTYENYPSDTHTQVTFKNHYADSKDYGRQHDEDHYKYQEEKESREPSNYVTQRSQSSIVSITPKPYNYHAHPVTPATTHTRSHKRNTGAAPYSQEQFQNISKLISRLRKTKSVLEPKAA